MWRFYFLSKHRKYAGPCKKVIIVVRFIFKVKNE